MNRSIHLCTAVALFLSIAAGGCVLEKDDDDAADDDTTTSDDDTADDDTTPGDDDTGDDDTGDDDTGDDDTGDDDTTGDPDADGDGYPASVDCDDSDPALNLDDFDADGASTCGGDCDDGDALLNTLDLDGDGQDTCSGDCDDASADTFVGATEQCDGADNDCNEVIPDDEVDADGDGYRVCEDDCDDTAVAVNPGVAEVTCNGLDDDCDPGSLDEPDGDADGATLCVDCDDSDAALNLNDVDGDGYTTCDADCDDNVDVTYPGAEEICDGSDNDCDLAVPADETDGDGDAQMICAGDCDDADSATYSGATELCDGLDNDCLDGPATDEADDDGDGWMVCEADCDDADPLLTPGDLDGDGWSSCAGDCDDGDPSLELDDFDGDGWSTCAGDCDDGEASVHPAAAEICGDGVDNNCNADADGCTPAGTIGLALADGKLVGEAAGDQAGIAASPASDVNGDGFDDLLIGASGADVSGNDSGAAYLVLGPLTGTSNLANAAARYDGEAAGDHAGHVVSSAGDIDGDGEIDLLVGAPQADSNGEDAGTAYLVLGPLAADAALATADATFVGEAAGDLAGRSIAGVGDIDGDGYGDLVIGAEQNDDAGENAGAAYLVYGPVSGEIELSSVGAKLTGEAAHDLAGGGSVALAGDIDGDGYGDVLVGAYFEDTGGVDSGAAYLLHDAWNLATSLSAADVKMVGVLPGDRVGSSLGGAGDLDGDGYDDLIIGAQWDNENASDAGAAYVVYGPVSGPGLDLALADAKLLGEAESDGAGESVAGAGDVNGDGFDDVVVGAAFHDDAGTDAGVAYMMLGPVLGTIDMASADARFMAEAADDRVGSRVSAAGDVNCDGYDDLLVGAFYHDAGGNNAGAVYLILGGGI